MKRAWRLIKIVVAFTIILFAALLGLVPGIPGWPLAIVGLTMLAAEFVWAARLLKRLKSGAARLKDAASFWPKRRKDGRSDPKA